jgi:hypothetical protein
MSLMRFVKLAAAPLALLALTAGVFRGEGFSINFPEGWNAPAQDSDGLFTTKEAGQTGANCNVENRKLATLDGYTQADLNEDYDHVFTLAEWSDFLAVETSRITIISGEVRRLGEHRLQIATLRIKLDDVDATARYAFFVLPGRVVMAGCYAETTVFPAYAVMYESAISSLLPF